MSFPVTANNGAKHTLSGVEYTYVAASDTWERPPRTRNGVHADFGAAAPNKDGSIYFDNAGFPYKTRLDAGNHWAYDRKIHTLQNIELTAATTFSLGTNWDMYKLVRIKLMIHPTSGNITPMLALGTAIGDIMGQTVIDRHIRWGTGGEKTRAATAGNTQFINLFQARRARSYYIEMDVVRPDVVGVRKSIQGFVSGRRTNDAGQLWYFHIDIAATAALSSGRMTAYRGQAYDCFGEVLGFV